MCYKCGAELKFSDTVSRSDECPVCGAAVRCCRNCRWYEPGSHYDCHETIDDPVSDKERSNFCDYFKLQTTPGSGSSSRENELQNARNAFNALFGD